MLNDKTSSDKASINHDLYKGLGADVLLDLLIEVSQSVSEALVVYDADGLLVMCNQNFRDLYGYTDAEARPGVHYRDLGKIDVERGNVAIGDEYGSGDDYLARKAEYRNTLQGSFIVQMKDGRWFKTTDRRLPRGGFVSVQSDITNEKRTELELRLARDAADIANKTKSDFLANMSHELRTPLNSILGFTHVMINELYGDLGNPKYAEYTSDIHTSAQHLLSVVSDILDLSKIEAGEFTIEENDVNVSELADYIARMMSPRALSREIELAMTDVSAAMTVRADRRHMRQILLNLVDNAIKYTPAGGTVSVSCHINDRQELLISVKDTGIGMAEADIELVLEPFRQLRRSPNIAYEGTGLGLPLAKKMAEMHSGSILIESTEGAGTTVTLKFPPERLISAHD